MANVLINETTMSAIGESIRTKGGTTAKLLPADMPQAITDIKSGIEPLDHTVTFMVDGSPYEIVSVKNGNSVNAPATEPTSASGSFNGWDNNGVKQTFPFVPNTNIDLTAKLSKETYADKIYTAYGVSPEEYPFLICSYSMYPKIDSIDFAFFKQTTDSNVTSYGISVSYPNLGGKIRIEPKLYSKAPSTEDFTNLIINRKVSLTSNKSAWRYENDYAYGSVYANSNYTQATDLHRLDQ